MKPLGLRLTYDIDGREIGLRVTPTSRAVDSIWEAVEEAQAANMTPEKFTEEVRAAWAHLRREQAKHEDSVLRGPL